MTLDTPRTDKAERTADSLNVMDAFEFAIYHGQKLERELAEANERIKRLEETLIGAWEIIANVSGGDWMRQKPHWQDYVFQWRDDYFGPIMKELSELKAKEDKP